MQCGKIVFGSHALRRMFQRAVSIGNARMVIESGEPIADYPEDRPFPNRLLLGFAAGQPLHGVVAVDQADDVCLVVTVYRPSPGEWDTGYKFECRGSNFKDHGHDPAQCGLIVCWIHDWVGCPVEALELRSQLKCLSKG